MNPDNLPYIVMAVVLIVVMAVALSLLYAHSRRQDETRIRQQADTISGQEETIDSLKLRLGGQIEQKDKVYEERNLVVTLFARTLMENGLVGEGPNKWQLYRSETPEFVGWEPVLYFVPPTETTLQQMSWRFKREHVYMLESLGLPEARPGFWDGRNSVQKYENIRAYLAG